MDQKDQFPPLPSKPGVTVAKLPSPLKDSSAFDSAFASQEVCVYVCVCVCVCVRVCVCLCVVWCGVVWCGVVWFVKSLHVWSAKLKERYRWCREDCCLCVQVQCVLLFAVWCSCYMCVCLYTGVL